MSDEPAKAPDSAVQPAGDAIDREALRKVRGAGGRFLAGAPGPRLTTGLRARTLVERPEIAAAHREMVTAIEADMGADVSTLKRDAVREAARLMLIVDSLGNDLLTRGVLTAKGKNRAALTAYAMTLDRLQKLMGTLGVERKSRTLPTTIDGLVASLDLDARDRA